MPVEEGPDAGKGTAGRCNRQRLPDDLEQQRAEQVHRAAAGPATPAGRSPGLAPISGRASTGSAPRRYEHALLQPHARPESPVTGAPGLAAPNVIVSWSPRQMPETACASGRSGPRREQDAPDDRAAGEE